MSDGRRAGVLGASVSRSLSPAIFAWLARDKELDLAYERFERADDAGAVALFDELRRDARFVGCNVTIPYKEVAARSVDRRSPIAQRLGAVNVVARRADGTLDGHNTDVAGILATLDAHGVDARGKRIAVLGAGGAGAAAVYALAQRAPAEIVVVNRTPARAEVLVERLAPHVGCPLRAAAASADAYEIVVDATPATVPEIGFLPRGWAFDLKYGGMPSPLRARAQAAGATFVDGLAMLVAQALATYEIWFRDGQPFARDEHRRLMTSLLDHLQTAP